MNRRNFIRNLVGASIGVAALTVLPKPTTTRAWDVAASSDITTIGIPVSKEFIKDCPNIREVILAELEKAEKAGFKADCILIRI